MENDVGFGFCFVSPPLFLLLALFFFLIVTEHSKWIT